MDLLQWALFFIILYAAFNALRYSRSTRKATNPREKGIESGKMNMALGAMLISMAFIQIFYYEGSSVRVAIGIVFLALGLFNAIAGYRNYSKWNQTTER
jgi:hypothetical protein